MSETDHQVPGPGSPDRTPGSLQILGDVDDIGHHGGSRGQLARPPAIKHHVADGVSGDGNGVEHVLHPGQGVGGGHQMGGHKGAELSLPLPDGPAQQLDLIAAGVGIGHIGQGDAPDALGGHLVRVDVLPEGQGCQDADLPAGVVSVYVGGGVPLRVTVLLCLLQRLLEGAGPP